MSFIRRDTIICETTTQDALSFEIGRNTIATVTARTALGTWSAAVLQLVWRLDQRDDWNAFGTNLTITSAAPYQFGVTVFGLPHLGVRVSTLESGVRLFVTCWAEGET